jgi:hypothetical protein
MLEVPKFFWEVIDVGAPFWKSCKCLFASDAQNKDVLEVGKDAALCTADSGEVIAVDSSFDGAILVVLRIARSASGRLGFFFLVSLLALDTADVYNHLFLRFDASLCLSLQLLQLFQ